MVELHIETEKEFDEPRENGPNCSKLLANLSRKAMQLEIEFHHMEEAGD